MGEAEMFKYERNSKMLLNEVYFWTATVKDWKTVFTFNDYKFILINSLRELVSRELIKVYGFVIMPNHIHLLWEMSKMNGKEMPHASFNKFTSHKIFEDMKLKKPFELSGFTTDDGDRKFRLWQRDSLAILIDSRQKAEQKLEYIHLNPLQERWGLAQFPEDYEWSSARFYQDGIDNFGFLTDYREMF